MCLRARKWTKMGWIFSAANKPNVTITIMISQLFELQRCKRFLLLIGTIRGSFFEIFLSKLVKTASVFLFTLSPLRCSFNQLKCNFSNLKPLQSSLERCCVFPPLQKFTRELYSCLAWLLLCFTSLAIPTLLVTTCNRIL